MVTMKMHIRSHKEPLDTEIRIIPIKKLKLDRDNVRFRHLSKDRPLSDAEIESEIWKESETKSLYNQIINSGGLLEHPFVDENNVVREGNRRLACLRQIERDFMEGRIEPLSPLTNFTEIECRVPMDSIAPIDLDILLAIWHVKDKKPWAKLNQASHIYDMRDRRGLSYDDIAKAIGMSKGAVLQCCKSFEWTTEYMKIYKVKNVTCWSFFEELYKKKTLRNWVVNDRRNLEKFFEWVYNEKFPMAINVRKLPDILFNLDKQLGRDLMELFNLKGKNIHDAIGELATHDPSLNNSFFKVIQRIRKRLDKMSKEELREMNHMLAKKKSLIALRDKINEITKLQ